VPSRKLPGRALKGETVVVDARARRVFVMTTVGGTIWAGVERGASAGEITAELVARFRVTEEQAAADVHAYFDRLETAGLAEAKK
jgi:Coenzyme PQQ synthesis protein D (PqqD)